MAELSGGLNPRAPFWLAESALLGTIRHALVGLIRRALVGSIRRALLAPSDVLCWLDLTFGRSALWQVGKGG